MGFQRCLKMNSIEIYLIRHGKTPSNEKRLYCGATDVSLSDNGIKEIKALKIEIEYPVCDVYYTSGAKRANETFELIYENSSYEILSDFFEYNFGDFEMKSYDMLKENEDYIKWISDNSGKIACPNGESKAQYNKRIENAFITLVKEGIKENKKRIFLLSHGGTIGTILEKFYDDSKSFYEYQPSNGRGYKVIVEVSDKVRITEFENI